LTTTALTLLTGATLLPLASCVARGGGGKPQPASSVTLYETGQYGAAYEQASREAEKLTGVPRDEAALIAGLSAHALNKNAEATRWLRSLSNSRDAVLAGKSNAALGLIAQERAEHEQAAQHLAIAGEKLPGDEGARACMYSGDSLTALGRRDEATAAYTRAQEQVKDDAGLRIMIGDRLRGIVPTKVAAAPTAPPVAPSSLTVQVGAWGNMTTAQRQAQKLAGTSQVRIIPILKDGRRLYAVRVGRFSSREAAEQVKNAIGGTAVVTIASGE
jgi:tetratricopeptide (TPR) repeat protein